MDLIFSESKTAVSYTSNQNLKSSEYDVQSTVKAYWNKDHKILFVHLSLDNEEVEWLIEDLASRNEHTTWLKDLINGQKILEFQYSYASAVRRAICLFDDYCQLVSTYVSRIYTFSDEDYDDA